MTKDRINTLEDERLESGRLMTKPQLKRSHLIIHLAAVICGVIGLLPIPIADAIPIVAVQVLMLFLLGRVFDQKVSSSVSKTLFGVTLATLLGRALVRLIPVAGSAISALVAFVVTEIIGWKTAHDMAELFRMEWERKRSNKDAADAYAEAAYWRTYAEQETEAEDFSDC